MTGAVPGRPRPAGTDARGWFDHGVACEGAGDAAGALDAYRRSIRINPHTSAPWLALASLMAANEQAQDARTCLIHAVRANPRQVTARLRLADAHRELGSLADAERECAAVLALEPGNAAAHRCLGQIREDRGEPEQAATAYRAALTTDPADAMALANLLGLGRQVDIGAEIEQARRRMTVAEPRARALIGYGLGKALDRRGEYDAAFHAMADANAARREVAGGFDRAAFDARIEAMIGLFPHRFFTDRQGWGDPSRTPVLVVGLPRSGTTLTEQILSSHPECFGAGELGVLTDLATGTPDRLGRGDTIWPRCAADLSAGDVAAIGRDYLAALASAAGGQAHRVVDKQPLNFWHLGLVAMALPQARIVHCTRDIRDCGLSIFAENFSPNQHWATDLADIAHYWRGYRRLMRHWQEATGLAMLDVGYEDTVADIDGQARRLLDFVDLPWDDRVLAFHRNDRAVQTPSRWQVRQPIYSASRERWRRYEAHLGPLFPDNDKGPVTD